MTAIADPVRASVGQTFAYALGSVGTGVFTTVPSVLLLFYSTEVAGVGPGRRGRDHPDPQAVVPGLGSTGRRVVRPGAPRPWGRRAPFLLAGAVGVSAAFAALFAARSEAGRGPRRYGSAAPYFLLSSVYSIYAVPYVAIPAEAATDREAGRLIAWRMALAMAGVILGAAGAPLMVQGFGGGLAGYRAMGLVVGGSCLLMMLAPLSAVRRDVSASRAPDAPVAWKAVVRGPYLWLAAAYVLQMAGVAVVSAVMPYLVTRVLGRGTGDVGVAMAVILVATMLSVPIWSRLGARQGEARVLKIAAALYAVAALMPAAILLLRPGWPQFLVSVVLLGVGFAGLQSAAVRALRAGHRPGDALGRRRADRGLDRRGEGGPGPGTGDRGGGPDAPAPFRPQRPGAVRGPGARRPRPGLAHAAGDLEGAPMTNAVAAVMPAWKRRSNLRLRSRPPSRKPTLPG